jgi:hypothetical protein
MESLFRIEGFAFFTEFFLKSTLVLAIALGLSYLFKKQSAAFRHFLLSVSLIGLLFLPFLSAFVPGWNTGFIPLSEPGSTTYVVTVTGDIHSGRVDPSPVTEGMSSRNQKQASAGLPGEHASSDGTPFLGPLYRYGFIALWCLVSCFLLGKILFGLYGVSRLTRRGVSLDGYPWEELFRTFFMVFGSFPIIWRRRSPGRNVRLVKNERIVVPMTWGVLKPVVLLPTASSEWPVDQCSSVLFHELSHIKRWDFPVALLSRIACSLYWFNPLSRIVFRRLRKEQEKACDEMVLKAGIRPSTYASSLLRMKKSLDNGQGRILPAAALGMAGLSEFNERLTTILTKPLKSKEIRMKSKILLLILVFLLITLIGTANPYQASAADKEKAVKKTKIPAAPAVPAAPATAETPEPPAVPAPEAKPATAAVPEAAAVSEAPEAPEAPETPAVPADVKDKKKEKEKKKTKKKVKAWTWIDEKDGKVNKLIITSSDLKGKKIKEIKLDGHETYYIETDKSGSVWHIRTKDGKKKLLKSLNDKDCHIEVVGGKIILTTEKGKGKDKHIMLIKTEDGKEGKHVIIKKSKGKGEKDLDIWVEADEDEEIEADEEKMEIFIEKDTDHDEDVIEIKNARDDEHLFVISKSGEDGKKGVKMVVSSDNELGKDLQNKLQKLVAELRKDLPKSYVVESEIGKTTQKVSIDYPMEKMDEKTREKARERIGDFMKKFKKIFSSLKVKKPLKKEILIKPKSKEA